MADRKSRYERRQRAGERRQRESRRARRRSLTCPLTHGTVWWPDTPGPQKFLATGTVNRLVFDGGRPALVNVVVEPGRSRGAAPTDSL